MTKSQQQAAILDALKRIGHIIMDAPYRGEERDGAWQAFLSNKGIITAALEAPPVPSDASVEQARDRIIFSNGDPTENADALIAAVRASVQQQGLDYEHHSSCGHVWTMRATACPECFVELRQRVEKAEAQLRASSDAGAGQGWQPIASVPKDGTWFLAWEYDLGFMVYRMGPGFLTGEDPQPTHWMPLPPAPASREDEK